MRLYLLPFVVPMLSMGCDSGEVLQQVMATTQKSMPGQAVPGGELMKLFEEEPEPQIADAAPRTPPPSPGRIDPFRYPPGFGSDEQGGDRTDRSQVKILGFVETDQPRVLLAVGDRTATLGIGESIGRVRVDGIEIPHAQLTLDGVSWNASLFDRPNR